MLSPCGSQITITPDAGPDDDHAGEPNQLKEELDLVLVHCVVSFQLISSGAQSGQSGIFCIRGGLLLFWFHSRTLYVSGCCNAIFMYYVKW